MTRNVLCTSVYIANSIERVGEPETERLRKGNGMLLFVHYTVHLNTGEDGQWEWQWQWLTTSPTTNATTTSSTTTRGHRHAITPKRHRQSGCGHLLASPQTHLIPHRNSSFEPWLFSPHTHKWIRGLPWLVTPIPYLVRPGMLGTPMPSFTQGNYHQVLFIQFPSLTPPLFKQSKTAL